VLEDYKDMIRDTTSDLQEHLKRLEEKVQILASRDDTGGAHSAIEWQAMLEEKESTQQGLRICAQLSAQIEELEPTSKENPQLSQLPSAHKYIKNGLDVTKGSIQSMVSRLQNHEAAIDRQMESMRSKDQLSEPDATQLIQLQETKESIHKCIQVVAEASEGSIVVERRNVFEDITMADDTYDFSISTVGDLVTARRIHLTGRSRHVAGQLSNESYQKTIDAFTKLDVGSGEQSTQGLSDTISASELEKEGSIRSVFGRYGPGNTLSSPAHGTSLSKEGL
jgi:hypothetical protein